MEVNTPTMMTEFVLYGVSNIVVLTTHNKDVLITDVIARYINKTVSSFLLIFFFVGKQIRTMISVNKIDVKKDIQIDQRLQRRDIVKVMKILLVKKRMLSNNKIARYGSIKNRILLDNAPTIIKIQENAYTTEPAMIHLMIIGK